MLREVETAVKLVIKLLFDDWDWPEKHILRQVVFFLTNYTFISPVILEEVNPRWIGDTDLGSQLGHLWSGNDDGERRFSFQPSLTQLPYA